MGENNFSKMPQNSVRITINQKNIVAVCWTHQVALCYQPCHGEFIAKIIGSPNMVYMVVMSIRSPLSSLSCIISPL